MPKRGDQATRETGPDAGPAGGVSVARRWSRAEKAAIVEESFLQGNSVTAVARKYRVSAVSLYQWRKKFPAGIMAMINRAESGAPVSPAPRRILRSALPGRAAESGADPCDGDPAGELARLRREVARYRARHAALVGLLRHLSIQLQHLAELDSLQDDEPGQGSAAAAGHGPGNAAPAPERDDGDR